VFQRTLDPNNVLLKIHIPQQMAKASPRRAPVPSKRRPSAESAAFESQKGAYLLLREDLDLLIWDRGRSDRGGSISAI
jgi:hypothetical protein